MSEEFWRLSLSENLSENKIENLSENKINKALTEREEFDLTTLQLNWLIRVCKVFREGDLKYGVDNWKLGLNNKEWIRERLNHGIKHLFKAKESILNGISLSETLEDDLGKVVWCCFVMMSLSLSLSEKKE